MNSMTSHVKTQIEMSSNLFRNYVKMRISTIKSYDTYVQIYLDGYARMLSQFNTYFPK